MITTPEHASNELFTAAATSMALKQQARNKLLAQLKGAIDHCDKDAVDVVVRDLVVLGRWNAAVTGWTNFRNMCICIVLGALACDCAESALVLSLVWNLLGGVSSTTQASSGNNTTLVPDEL